MVNMLRACLDWRVITALGALGVGVVLFAPNLIAAALPLLIVAACPLSMMLMMKTMGGHGPNADARQGLAPAERAEHLRTELASVRRQQQRLVQELEALDAAPIQAAPPSHAASAPSSPTGSP